MVEGTSHDEGHTGVVLVTDDNVELLTDFYRLTWDPTSTNESVLRARSRIASANPHGTGIVPPTFLFLHHGLPIGHLGSIPIRLHSTQWTANAYWLKGLMVLPEHRSGPVGFLLIRSAIEHVSHSMALVVSQDAQKLFLALGYRDLGNIWDYVRVLDAAGLMRLDFKRASLGGYARYALTILGWINNCGLTTILGAALSTMFAAWNVVFGSGLGDAHIGPIGSFDGTEIDRLWEDASADLCVVPCRNFAHLVNRYPSSAYAAVLIRRSGQPVALAVVRKPSSTGAVRLPGARIAVLSDLIAIDTSAALAAIAAAEGVARESGAHALVAGGTHHLFRRYLSRRAFLPIGGRVRLLVRPAPGVEIVEKGRDWWVTRGDSYADEVF